MADTRWQHAIALLARRRVPLGFVMAAVAAVLAQPTWESWRAGLLVAAIGEAIRIWAAGHLEKGREVTRSGPYRFTAHPLYVGSSIMAFGVVVAAHDLAVAALAALYMGATITSAVRTEEAFLRQRFGGAYDAYRRAPEGDTVRRFSLRRAMRNREYRALIGLAIGFAFLALKASQPI